MNAQKSPDSPAKMISSPGKSMDVPTFDVLVSGGKDDPCPRKDLGRPPMEGNQKEDDELMDQLRPAQGYRARRPEGAVPRSRVKLEPKKVIPILSAMGDNQGGRLSEGPSR